LRIVLLFELRIMLLERSWIVALLHGRIWLRSRWKGLWPTRIRRGSYLCPVVLRRKGGEL
jgi:hypothetical protein